MVFVILELKEKEKLHSPPVYPAEKQKESIIRLDVTLSHLSGNLQYQYLNDQVAGLLKSGNKKADWLTYY